MNESLNSGRYFLGDPSFVLSSKIYNGIWGDVHGYSNGKHCLNGYDFIAHTTCNGDGIFYDTKKRKYTVESGVISLVHTDLIEDIKLCNKHGYIFDFNHKIDFIYDAGCFYIKSNKNFIIIDTNNEKRDLVELTDSLDDIFEENYVDDNGENIGRTIIGDSDVEADAEDVEDLEDLEDSEDSEDPKDIDNIYIAKYSDIPSKISFFKKK